jgi:RHS repeat-associated protein
VRQGTTLKATYAYNGRGERVGVAAATLPTQNSRQYAYDEAGRLLGEYTTAGLRLKEYVWLDDLLVAILGDHDGSTYQYVETDHLGTPRAVVHPSQNQMIWRWNLNNTAFGEHLPSENPDGNGLSYTLNLRYPGQYYDAESGLHYNYFRDYDPATGRYVESDPIGLSGGISTYAYVGSSALNRSDKNGLLWFGPSCNFAQQAAIITAIIDLSKDISARASSGCNNGSCDMSIAAAAMTFIARKAYFTCDRSVPCAEITRPSYIHFYPGYVIANESDPIRSPGQCGCLKAVIFHEAIHQVAYSLPEDVVRRKTLGCVSCAQKVAEKGGAL